MPETRREYQTLVTADGNFAPAHYGLGRCLAGTEAIAAYEPAVQLFARYNAARMALVAVYWQLG